MHTRVVENHVTRETSTTSESEKSFVSAESTPDEKRSSRPAKPSDADQSAILSPSSQPHPLAAVNFTFSPKRTKQPNEGHSQVSLSSRRPSPPLSPSEASYFTRQPGASGLDTRTHQLRRPARPPASRSSRFVETKSGPPPALSTQRCYTDSPRRASPSPHTRSIHPPLKLPANPTNRADTTIDLPHESTNEGAPYLQKRHSARVTDKRPSTSDGVMTTMEQRDYRRSESDEERDSTLRIGDQDLQRQRYRSRTDAYEPSPISQEDLFLDLARDKSVIEEPLSRNERRRSRLEPLAVTQSRPTLTGRPSTSGGDFARYQNSTKKDHNHVSSFDSSIPRSPRKTSLASLRDPLSTDRHYAASAHPLDQRHRPYDTRSSFGATNIQSAKEERSMGTPIPYGRRRSIREPSPGINDRGYKQSHLSYTPNGDPGSSPNRISSAFGRDLVQETSHAEGTESTVSTTAPSTVWDELDDLKSRLRKLEITGLLPKSSNAAISTANGDRPRTATTTVTTMSSSPKRRQTNSTSPEASTIKCTDITNLHPLLHSALAKAKPLTNPSLYRALEATASDALTLAALTGGTSSQGASAASANGIDRQLRRKADSMCRSLTELCIALAEDLPDKKVSKIRPTSGDTAAAEPSLPQPKLLRGASEESETRTSSRVMSRLEARRTSLLNSSPLNGSRVSPHEATTPTQVSTPISSRLDRNSSVLLRKRSTAGEVDLPESRRPASRAATEVGQVRPSIPTRMSREYTSQHPLPNNPQPSTSTQSSLPARKSYFGSTASSPLTPSIQPGNRRYLDRSTPPSSADSERLAEARQRRLASLGNGQSRINLSSGRLRQSESER